VWVRGEKVFGAGVEVGEVAAASAGDEDLLAGLFGVVEEEDAAIAATGLDGAQETSSAGTEDDDVDGGVWISRGHGLQGVSDPD
jgi:hypothetical protein